MAQQQAPFFTPARPSASASLASPDRHGTKGSVAAGSAAGRHHSHNQQQHFKGHQRRQSVARLLPEISKLRLLSWLVEASNELIKCDIAIMDGVYAKLNRSRESLLFWQQQGQVAAVAASRVPPARPPPPPPIAPVSATSKLQRQQFPQPKSSEKTSGAADTMAARKKSASRNHHSLPLTNYDAPSLTAISSRSSAASGIIPASGQLLPPVAVAPPRSIKGQPIVGAPCSSLPIDLLCDRALSATSGSSKKAAAHRRRRGVRDSNQTPGEKRRPADSDSSDYGGGGGDDDDDDDDDDDGDDDDDDDDDDESTSSAASSGSVASTASSGIHGAASLSSSASSSGTASSPASSCASSSNDTACSFGDNGAHEPSSQQSSTTAQPQLSSAEQLSEQIRRSVVEHNYLQTLLVNVIRQHDRLVGAKRNGQSPAERLSELRVDLAELAESLGDGCMCLCHSRTVHRSRAKRQLQSERSSSLPINQSGGGSAMSSTLSLFQPKRPGSIGRKLRRKPKGANNGNHLEELSREDMVQKFADKLCANCVETHYWLHSCAQFPPLEFASSLGDSATTAQTDEQQIENLNAVISLRNATFIKLVQQQVRSTISKSIELIDLIRKEIKSPESIKQKQLMRCFSASVQLLTSVAGYVVPTQDISTFLPNELAHSSLATGHQRHRHHNQQQQQQQQQTNLFNLPPSDFDHLLLYSGNAALANVDSGHNSNPNRSSPYSSISGRHHLPLFNYHLAVAPEIPIRRRIRSLKLLEESPNATKSNDGLSLLKDRSRSSGSAKTSNKPSGTDAQKLNDDADADQASAVSELDKQISHESKGERDETTTKAANTFDSSSGASSNNSSASSSIARGTVQQSSLTRAHTSSAILSRDGNKQRTPPSHHDLTRIMSSYETTSSLNRHNPYSNQQDDDFLALHSSRSPKFWHSSKFNFIKKLIQVKQQRLLRQQSKDRRIHNNKVQNKFRLVMMDLIHFNKSQQLLTTENGVNSLLTSMRNVLEFGLYLTDKLY